jgi:putative PIN family toxin of toxin-antitoxin system
MPPRVFIDTNTLVSGLLFAGNEAKLLNLALDEKIKLVMSEQVVEETKRTLVEKFMLNPAISSVVVVGWSKVAEIVEAPREEAKKFRGLVGAKDAKILAAALKSKADFFISGDRSFHQEKIKRMINVVTTRQFLRKLAKASTS